MLFLGSLLLLLLLCVWGGRVNGGENVYGIYVVKGGTQGQVQRGRRGVAGGEGGYASNNGNASRERNGTERKERK